MNNMQKIKQKHKKTKQEIKLSDRNDISKNFPYISYLFNSFMKGERGGKGK